MDKNKQASTSSDGKPKQHRTGYTPSEKKAMKAPVSTFAQLTRIVHSAGLNPLVEEFEADKWTKRFGAIQHLDVMIYSQVAHISSLRGLSYGLELYRSELNHLGLPFPPGHSTIAYANEHRDWRFFEAAFKQTLSFARNAIENPVGGLKRAFKFKDKSYSIDSTTIDLCQSMYDWATFRTTKGGVKVHIVLENDTFLPVWAWISEAVRHDKVIFDMLDPVRGLPRGFLHLLGQGL
jgi:hypothetical protein